MVTRRRSRTWMTLGTGTLLAATLAYAFWPRAVMVDIGEAARTSMVVTIDEEAKTRVRDAYVVSAPIAGRLLRVEVEPGDYVQGGDDYMKGGETMIARMLPLPPSALDVRTREQARATVSAAEAALRVARADLNKAMADKDLADLDLKRTGKLHQGEMIATAELDRAKRASRSANASLDTAKAAISMREADLANARARLISFRERPTPRTNIFETEDAIPLTAPVSGRVLQVMQKSATTLAAGTPILEIGDISNDLEVVVELLSTDAVQVSAGNRVIIEKWGGPYPLSGIVERVEPWGFTKFSALGVEEQRVKGIIKFTDPLERRESLGHGFRVETRIVVWETEDTLTVPSSALFREKGGWAVYTVTDGRANFKSIEIGRSNGVRAEILSGLEAGDRIILYPGPGITAGTRVAQRQLN